MKIHPLSTGTVALKPAFLHARTGWRRRLDIFLPGPFVEPVPIHCWAVEHDGRLFLIDTGETATVKDIPFARFQVEVADELPAVLSAAGLAIDDVDTAVLTHMHGDHMDGAVHLRGPVLVHDRELAFAHGIESRIAQRLLRQPLPAGVDFTPVALDAGPFGGFARSRRLSDDGRIMMVDTPGHTPGHVSVICVDDDGRHVLLAGDATDSLEQLHALRPDAIGPKPAVSIATMRAILEHGRQHPTIYLPAHDPASAARLRDAVVL